jgi:polyhydroxyalkanoate synthesis regulator phasin
MTNLNSSRHISCLNHDLGLKHKLKVSIVTQLRLRLKELLTEIDQSTSLTPEQAKALLVELLAQPQTKHTPPKPGLKPFDG